MARNFLSKLKRVRNFKECFRDVIIQLVLLNRKERLNVVLKIPTNFKEGA